MISGCLLLSDGGQRTLPIALKTHLPFIDDLVVYDGSTDGSFDMVRKALPNIDLTRVPECPPKDFARFRNDCVKAAKGPWCLFMANDEFLWSAFSPSVFRDVLRKTPEHAFKIPRWNEPFAVDFPDPQTDLVEKGYGSYVRKLHECFNPPANLFAEGLLIIHMLRSKAYYEQRDAKWSKIDPNTQWTHMARPEIQQRVKDEKEHSPLV